MTFHAKGETNISIIIMIINILEIHGSNVRRKQHIN